MDPLTPQDPAHNASEAAPVNPPATPPAPPAPATPGVVVPAPPAQSGAGHVDLDKILLPKKEVPGQTPLSAQRINAGALLEQELAAGSLGTDTQQARAEEKAAEVKAQAATPAPAPAEEAIVKPLETFQRDIESVVQHDNVSVLTIATAEAKRRSEGGEAEPEAAKAKSRSLLLNAAMIAGGFIFLIGTSGALAYLATRTTTVPIAASTAPAASFISVDGVKEITITPDESRQQVMASLNAARQATSLSLGLMSQLRVTESTTTATGETLAPLSAQSFFTLLAPDMPATLARSFKPDYLLGVHVYNGNEAFLIGNVYSYEEAYSGMLAWERYMTQDLMPLFSYKPIARIKGEWVASTTPSAADQFIQTGFVDKIIENHDARALLNENGDVYLLWTFLDRNTLVITTNDATLREIISRLKNAPITPIPGQ